MEGESNSSSGESKALSAGAVDHLYKCPNCSRVFTSMRARGGHQIAHRKKRPIRKHKFSPNISPVLAAVLAHHISSDDEQQTAASKAEETSTQSAPETGFQPETNEQQYQYVTQQQKTDAVQLNRKAKAKKERSQRHPHKRSTRREKPQKQQLLCTQDFLTGWNHIADEAGTSKRSAEEATLDLFTRVSKEEDELDLDLQLRSKNADKVDLKLKLGF